MKYCSSEEKYVPDEECYVAPVNGLMHKCNDTIVGASAYGSKEDLDRLRDINKRAIERNKLRQAKYK